MWPGYWEVEMPGLDLFPSAMKTAGGMLVQVILPELIIEAFDVGVVHRLAGQHELQPHTVLVRPFIQCIAGELLVNAGQLSSSL